MLKRFVMDFSCVGFHATAPAEEVYLCFIHLLLLSHFVMEYPQNKDVESENQNVIFDY